MPITERSKFGALAEKYAAEFLESRGYTVLAGNYRKPWGEIDIVAQQDKELIFVEVKTQKEELEWRPEENITRHKKHQLSRIISTYLKEHKIPETRDWRIDVLAIKLDFKTKNAQVEYIQNINLN